MGLPKVAGQEWSPDSSQGWWAVRPTAAVHLIMAPGGGARLSWDSQHLRCGPSDFLCDLGSVAPLSGSECPHP